MMNKGSKNSDPNKSKTKTRVSFSDYEYIAQQGEEILNKIESLEFKRCFFGGVQEKDAWDKIEELNKMYLKLLRDERTRYNAILEEYKRNMTAEIGGNGEAGDGWRC